MMKAIGAEVLIDDSHIYASQCANANLKAVLFGSYPWNKNHHIENASIIRAEHWGEVPTVVDKLMNMEKSE